MRCSRGPWVGTCGHGQGRWPPNGTDSVSSRVYIPLTKPSSDSGASPSSACSRTPGANLEAQPAFVEYFVSLMRLRSSIGPEYNHKRPAVGHGTSVAPSILDAGFGLRYAWNE